MEQTFRDVLWWAWLILASFCLCRGTLTLILRSPARARLIVNGYRQDRKARHGAIFHKEIAPAPWVVEDWAAFIDAKGIEHRARLLRLAVEHDDDLLVWYDPRCPHKASAMGPLHWFGLVAAATATYLLLGIG
ncbi:MAG: hypothetical protein WBR13_15665 [Allosphingosinicella sp.]